jgi:hypothetical protein
MASDRDQSPIRELKHRLDRNDLLCADGMHSRGEPRNHVDVLRVLGLAF